MSVEFYINEHGAVNCMLQSTVVDRKQLIKLKIITYFRDPWVLTMI